MKVRMLRPMCGPKKLSLKVGDIYECTATNGASMCSRGVAEPVIERREKAVTATKRTKRKAKTDEPG